MKHLSSLILLFFIISYSALAQTASPVQLADSAYKQKNYSAAAAYYAKALDGAKKEDLSQEEKATIFYNLGNCHYRLKDYAHAILFYQRSLRLDPANDDAAFNLELTQAKLTDHFNAPSEMFFVSWVKKLMQSQSSNAWGLCGLAFLFFSLLFFSTYCFLRLVWVRKVSFSLACLLAVAFLCCQIFAWRQHSRFENLKQVVVMQTIDTFDTPTPSARKQKDLHEGTLLTVTDSYKGGWLQVEMPDGTQTWIKEQGIEHITQ